MKSTCLKECLAQSKQVFSCGAYAVLSTIKTRLRTIQLLHAKTKKHRIPRPDDTYYFQIYNNYIAQLTMQNNKYSYFLCRMKNAFADLLLPFIRATRDIRHLFVHSGMF
jgi:hypothetical protein